MPTPTDGLSTALAQVMQEHEDDAPPGSAEQLSLEDFLGLPPRPDGKPGNGHIGRPPGSQNRRVKEWVRFLEARYGNPLEVLMQIAFAKVDDLRAQVGCTTFEALQEKRLAATVLVPYFASRKPIALNVEERKIVYLSIDMAPSNGEGVMLHAALVPPETSTPAPAVRTADTGVDGRDPCQSRE
jgi:hypothetical protein